MQQLKVAVADKVDPRELTRRFPFVAIGTMLVAGFATAVVAIPSREQQELKRLERIRKAMHPEVTPPKSAKSDKADADGQPQAKGPLWLSIAKEVLQLVRPMLTTLVTAKLAQQDKPAPADASR